MKELTFEITTEDGTEKLTLAEYHKRPDLMEKFGYQANPPAGRDTVFLGKYMFSYPISMLREARRGKMFDEAKQMFLEEPLAYYVPQSSTALEFLNWRSNDQTGTFKIMLAGNGFGKSVACCIDVLLEILPCDPTWPIFVQHGVKQRPFRGPYPNGGVACVSYEMKNLETTIWPQVIRRWCPKKYIADYESGKKSISWNRSPKMDIFSTPLFFFAIKQSQAAFESIALNTYWWDEQGDYDRFNGANVRVRRMGGRHVQSMTPHAIKGRSDTGAGSYIHKIYKGELDVGMNVKFFEGDVNRVPDWVMREHDKADAMREWIEEPMRIGDKRKLAEGMARIYGKFHERSGLVFEDFDRGIHVVKAADIPENVSLYRYQDHGRKEPAACLLVGVDPAHNYWVKDEYYQAGEIPDTAVGIIAMSGNTRRMIGVPPNERWFEVVEKSDVIRTVGDPRSLSKQLDDRAYTIGQSYAKSGLIIQRGSGQPVQDLNSLVAELMMVSPKRKNPFTGEEGAPRLFISEKCEKLIWELENYRTKQERVIEGNFIVTQEKPIATNDHAITCLQLLAADKPRYVPHEVRGTTMHRWKEEEDEDAGENHDLPRCSVTGY